MLTTSALVWIKYPEHKPAKSGDYLITVRNSKGEMELQFASYEDTWANEDNERSFRPFKDIDQADWEVVAYARVPCVPKVFYHPGFMENAS